MEVEQTDPVELELPSVKDALHDASTSATEAIQQVKALEVQALAETINLVKGILSEVKDVLNQAQGMFSQAESYREEALEIMETLKATETESQDNEENNELQRKSATNVAEIPKGFLQGFKSIL